MDIILSDISLATNLEGRIIVLRLFGAVLLAGILGIEREWTKESAGLRTVMLISLASASLALIAQEMVASHSSETNTVRMDPLRLVEAVTAGVAFLAAGVIVFTKGTIRGLTTGASMWLAAAIGLSVGLGIWLIGLVATVLGFVILALLRLVEEKVGFKD